MCHQVSVPNNCGREARGSEAPHDRWVSRQLPPSLGSRSQAGLFQVWRLTWRINLMLHSAQNDLIIPQIHYLLSVSTTGAFWPQSPPKPSLALFLLPVLLFRLGCRRTQTGWDQSGCSNLTYSAEKVRHEFLGEAFLGRTLPAVWHAEKIRA